MSEMIVSRGWRRVGPDAGRRHARVLLLLSALTIGACYEFVPNPVPGTLVGRRVELTLTDSGALALAARIGPQVEVIDGALQSDSAGTFDVAVSATRTRGGVETDWRGERIAVPRTLVASLAERRFSPTRSALAGGLAALGIGTVTAALRGAGRGGQGGPGVGTTAGK